MGEGMSILNRRGEDRSVLNKERASALDMLSSFTGNGWLCPVTIYMPAETGQNQQEALEACLAALETLGIKARPAMRGEGTP